VKSIYDFQCKTEVFEDGRIEQMTNLADAQVREIIRTKDRQVREALIALGWTPPKDEPHEIR
jgi:hypothetical protein